MFLRRLTVPRCAENSRRGTSSFRTRRQDAPVVSAEAQGGVGHICAGVCGEVGNGPALGPREIGVVSSN